MENTIITKFTIATSENRMMMHSLTKALAYQKFSAIVEESILENYIRDNFNERQLKDEMNSMSNQWLTVYYDGEPAGYARITSKGIKPEVFEAKRVIRLADFGILDKFKDTSIHQSLLDKCLFTCRSYEGIWINEYLENPLIDFFKKNDFTVQKHSDHSFELPLSSVYLVRNHSN